MSRELIVDNVEKCKEYKYFVKSIEEKLMPYGAMIGMPIAIIELSDNKNDDIMDSIDICNACIKQNIILIKGKLGEGQVINPLVEIMHLNDQMVVLETDGTQPTPPDFDWVIVRVSKNTELKLHEQCFAAEYVFDADEEFNVDLIPSRIIEPPYGSIWLNVDHHIDFLKNIAMETPYLRYCLNLESDELTINNMCKKAHANSTKKGFWEDYVHLLAESDSPNVVKQYDTTSRLCLIHSEVSEALEALRNGEHKLFAEELADIMIRIGDLVGGLDIDLEHEVKTKMDKNASRGFKHGKLF